MKSQLVFLVLSAVALVAQSAAKPKVELYYETLCPYSREFVIEQLVPTYQSLQAYIDVEVIPFGNVNVTKGPDGVPMFTCQHGRSECWGNRVEACVINEVKNAEAPSLDFVNCMFSPTYFRDTHNTAPECAKTLGYDWNTISTCNNGLQGLNLIIANWHRTDALVPKHTYVPWIVIDGVHTEAMQDQAQYALQQYLCDNQLKSLNLPECKGEEFVQSEIHGRTFVKH